MYMMTSSNGNISRITSHLCGEFTGDRSFDVFFDLRLNKRLSKQSGGWWIETPSHPLWRYIMSYSIDVHWRRETRSQNYWIASKLTGAWTMVPLRGLSNFRATWQIPHTTWNICVEWSHWHYNDVILCSMASQITSLTNVYSNFYSGADQRKNQSSASLAFVWGKHRWPVISPHKWPVTRKLFLIDDVIMTNLYSTSRFGMYMNISISSDQKKNMKRALELLKEKRQQHRTSLGGEMKHWCGVILQSI